MATISYSETMYVQNCIECGVAFGMPTSLDTELRRNHKTFVCPHGHRQSYQGESEAEKLKRMLDAEQKRLSAQIASHDQTRAALRNTEKQLAAQKGQTTKLKNRVGNGVCPCCNRKFKQLAAHMKDKHPEFVPA